MGIRVSPKHGVNPSLGICFWCGQEDGTVLLLGMLPNDAEAPRHAVGSMEPCDKCKEQRALGITMIEMAQGPTGRWLVIKEEAVRRLINPGKLLDQILEKRAAYLEKPDYEYILSLIPPENDILENDPRGDDAQTT